MESQPKPLTFSANIAPAIGEIHNETEYARRSRQFGDAFFKSFGGTSAPASGYASLLDAALGKNLAAIAASKTEEPMTEERKREARKILAAKKPADPST